MKEEENLDDFYKITLHRLVQITKRVSSKYTRSKVRKALPKDFAYVIEELITENPISPTLFIIIIDFMNVVCTISMHGMAIKVFIISSPTN